MVKLKDGREVDLELFKYDSCPFCQVVYRTIRARGIEGIRMRDTSQEPGANAELIERGGKRQVPCMFVDGEPMYESGAISAWLEENVASAQGS